MAGRTPPPLPARNAFSFTTTTSSLSSTVATDDYSQQVSGLVNSSERPVSELPLSTDPRTSSTQSLVPSASGDGSLRTLLMVYIHGFYGNDQSFQSFPAHVHSLLVTLLSESHVVHSKIYPRYKTYRAIEVARDKFSAWLEPHESPTTDVILVGHSMGGLLAAEVALMVKLPHHSESPPVLALTTHCARKTRIHTSNGRSNIEY